MDPSIIDACIVALIYGALCELTKDEPFGHPCDPLRTDIARHLLGREPPSWTWWDELPPLVGPSEDWE